MNHEFFQRPWDKEDVLLSKVKLGQSIKTSHISPLYQLAKMFYWLVCKILTFFLQVVRYVSERVFPLIHANDVKVPLPPFADDVLSNSATQIADGIRTQKVNFCSYAYVTMQY